MTEIEEENKNYHKQFKNYHEQFKDNEWAYYLIPKIQPSKGNDFNIGVIINSNIKRAPLKSVIRYIIKKFNEKYPQAIENLNVKTNATKVELANDLVKFVSLSQPHFIYLEEREENKRTEQLSFEDDDEMGKENEENNNTESNTDSEWEPDTEYEGLSEDMLSESESQDEDNVIKKKTESQKANTAPNISHDKVNQAPEQKEKTEEHHELSETQCKMMLEEWTYEPGKTADDKFNQTQDINQANDENEIIETTQNEKNKDCETKHREITEKDQSLRSQKDSETTNKTQVNWFGPTENDDEDIEWDNLISEAVNNYYAKENDKYESAWHKTNQNETEKNQQYDDTYSYEIYQSCEENETMVDLANSLLNVTNEPIDADAPTAYKDIMEMGKEYSKHFKERAKISTNLTPLANNSNKPQQSTRMAVENITETQKQLENDNEKTPVSNKNTSKKPSSPTKNEENIHGPEVMPKPPEEENQNDKDSPFINDKPTQRTEKAISPPQKAKKPHRLTHRKKDQIISQYEKLEEEKAKIEKMMKEKNETIKSLQEQLKQIEESTGKTNEEIQEAIKKDESEMLEQLVNKIVENGKISSQKEEITKKHDIVKKNNQEKQNEIRKLKETLKEKDEWILQLHEQKEKEISIRIKTEEVNKLLYANNESLKSRNTELEKTNEINTKNTENLKIIVKEISKTKPADEVKQLKEENQRLQIKLKEEKLFNNALQMQVNDAQKEIIDIAEKRYDWLRPNDETQKSSPEKENKEKEGDIQIIFNSEKERQKVDNHEQFHHLPEEQRKSNPSEENNKSEENDDKRICQFFIRGECKLGNSCLFKHTKANKQINENEISITSEICRNHQRGYCRFGEQCKYKHPQIRDTQELYHQPPEEYRKSIPSEENN